MLGKIVNDVADAWHYKFCKIKLNTLFLKKKKKKKKKSSTLSFLYI